MEVKKTTLYISCHPDKPDIDFGRWVAHDLQQRGYEVWLDVLPDNLDDDWAIRSRESIELCDVFIAIISPDSLKLVPVQNEWLYAQEQKPEKMIGLVIRTVDMFSMWQEQPVIDFSNDYDQGINRLLDVLPEPDEAVAASARSEIRNVFNLKEGLWIPVSIVIVTLLCIVWLSVAIGLTSLPGGNINLPFLGGAAEEPTPTQTVASPTMTVPPATPTITPTSAPTPTGGAGWITFISRRNAVTNFYAISPDGTDLRQLSNGLTVTFDDAPDVTDDGSRMVFAMFEAGDLDIFTINLDGTALTQLTTHGAADHHPTWSPDGSQIAFVSARDGISDIYVMAADGSNVARLTQLSTFITTLDWSPDGSSIAFSSTHEGSFAVYAINTDGTNLRPLVQDIAYKYTYPVWSPDGTQLAFLSNQDGGDNDVFIIDLATGQVTQVTANNYKDTAPRWSPDGMYLVYNSERDTGTNIYTYHVIQRAENQLTDNNGVDQYPVWPLQLGLID